MVTIERVIATDDFCDLRRVLGSVGADHALYQALHQSLIVYQGKIGGQIACVWGLVPPTIMSSQAYIWLQTTPIADEHTFILVRYSKLMIEAMLKDFNPLIGHCRIGDERAIRWMRWLGAEFGPYQGHLIPFTIRRKHG